MDVKEAQKALRDIFMPVGFRIRVELGDVAIADSAAAMLLRDASTALHYFFPKADIRMDLLTRSDHTTHSGWRGDTQHWTVRAGDKIAEHAAWTYSSVPEGRPDTSDYITFDWRSMDAWYVEDERVYAHPRDPFSRVDGRNSSRRVRVEIDGVTVAETDRPVVLFETGLPIRYYVPQEDIRMDLLTPTDRATRCPYKGKASYWTAIINDEKHENIAWSYKKGDALPEVPRIEGLLAFYNEKVDLYVDGELQERSKGKWSRGQKLPLL